MHGQQNTQKKVWIYAAKAYFMFVLIKNVHLLGKKMVYAGIRYKQNGQLYNNTRHSHLLALSYIFFPP